MTSDARQFEDAIVAAPEADEPRLIYADWLETQGDPRGEFIRLQVRLAQLPGWDPSRFEIELRAQELLHEFGEQWAGPIAEANVMGLHFERGLVAGVETTAADFLSDAETFFELAPLLRRAVIHETSTHCGELMNHPCLARLTALDLSRNSLSVADIHEIGLSPCLRQLSSLNLDSNAIGDRAVRHLAPGSFAQLTNVSLQYNSIGAGGLRALFACHGFSAIERLRLRSNRVRHQALGAIADSPFAAGLLSLSLSANALNDRDLQPLIKHSLDRIDSLDLSENSLQIEGARQLCRASWLPKLRRLNLRYNGLRAEGVEALCEALVDSRVEQLELAGNQMGNDGIIALAQRARLGRLRYLDLASNYIEDHGVEALLESPLMERLEKLILATNKISETCQDRLLMECQLRGITVVVRRWELPIKWMGQGDNPLFW